MAKKRKTRQEKIILQLKRQLNRQQIVQPVKSYTIPQKTISIPTIKKSQTPKKEPTIKNQESSIFSFNPQLIKKDLLKTLVLTLIIVSFEFVLYLKLK